MGFQAFWVRSQEHLKVFDLFLCGIINVVLEVICGLHQELLKLKEIPSFCVCATSFRSLMHDAQLLIILTILRYDLITLLLRISIGPKVIVLDASDILDRSCIIYDMRIA